MLAYLASEYFSTGGHRSISAMFTQSYGHMAAGQATATLPWRRRCPRILPRFMHELRLADIRERSDMRRRSNGARPGPN